MIEPPRERQLREGIAAALLTAGRDPQSDELPPVEQVRVERARRRLSAFVRQAWRVVEPTTLYRHNWHIDAICEHLEAARRGEIRKLLINVPPRHSKSLIVSVFWPTWTWIDQPETRWLFSSYAQSLSTRDSVKSRNVIQSPWYQARWGHVFRLVGDQNEKIRFENSRTGVRIATSVGGSATGEGGDYLVCDDPHNVNEAESDAVRTATVGWWDQVMSTRLNNPATGVRVVIMQRVHTQDLAGHLLAQGGWEHLCLPSEYEPRVMVTVGAALSNGESAKPQTSIGFVDPRTEPGELLWPERFGSEVLAEARRELGSHGYAGQHQQRPAPREGGLFKRSWWRYYQPLSLEQIEAFDAMIQSWDMSFTDSPTSSRVAGGCWGRRGGDYYLLDLTCRTMAFTETKRAVVDMAMRWPMAHAKLVENKANGPAVMDALRHEVSGLLPWPPPGAARRMLSKEARAAAITPVVEAGNVYLPDPQWCPSAPDDRGRPVPWVLGYIDELADFPNAPHDDLVDMTSQALDYLSLKQTRLQIFAE